MAEQPTVPVRVRRVSGELRELRRRHGLAADEVARALGISVSKLSRVENGIRKPVPDDVSALLGLYRVPAPRRDELLSLVATARTTTGRASRTGSCPGCGTSCPSSSRKPPRSCVAAANEELVAADLDRYVEHRTARQAHWRRPDGPSLHVITDENVCGRPVGGAEVMRSQLRHIVQVARQSKLTVQILPGNVGAHPGVEGSFMLLDFEGQPALAYIEHRCSGTFFEASEHVTATKKVFRRLRQLALSPEDSVDLIASIADEMA